MRQLWLGLLLCACSGSSDNEVEGSVLGNSLTARDAIFFVHNGRQLVVVSNQDATCRQLKSQTITGDVRLLEMYLWNAGSPEPANLVEGTYEVDGTVSLESEAYFGAGRGCNAGTTRWFRAGTGRVILIHAGFPEPGERAGVAFRLNFGDEVLTGHADASYCDLPETGLIGCINEGPPGEP